jgi:diguanylate cyclase (GGDEF)-like protein
MNHFQREATVYGMVIAILATLSIGSYLVINSIVLHQQHMASVIDVSSRQRMLSQRISALSQQLAQPGDQQSRESIALQLRESIDLMGRSHRDLIEGSRAMGISPPQSPALRSVYFSPPHDLDHRIPMFLRMADEVLVLQDRGASPAAIHKKARTIAATADALLDSLDVAVSLYAGESEAVFRQSQVRVVGVTVAMMIALATEALFIFLPMFRRMRELVSLAQSDPVSPCHNRRYLLEAAGHSFARSRQTGAPLSAIIVDIDHLKSINDSHGHAAGDAVIGYLCQTVATFLGEAPMLGRLGGDEFAVILPETTAETAVKTAQTLRSSLEHNPVLWNPGAGEKVLSLTFSVSCGVAQIHDTDQDFLALLERADGALIEAKQGGGNSVKYALTPFVDPSG